MRPYDKFMEIDRRLDAIEATLRRLEELLEAISDEKPIACDTIAPPTAKRRGRPPKAA